MIKLFCMRFFVHAKGISFFLLYEENLNENFPQIPWP